MCVGWSHGALFYILYACFCSYQLTFLNSWSHFIIFPAGFFRNLQSTIISIKLINMVDTHKKCHNHKIFSDQFLFDVQIVLTMSLMRLLSVPFLRSNSLIIQQTINIASHEINNMQSIRLLRFSTHFLPSPSSSHQKDFKMCISLFLLENIII